MQKFNRFTLFFPVELGYTKGHKSFRSRFTFKVTANRLWCTVESLKLHKYIIQSQKWSRNRCIPCSKMSFSTDRKKHSSGKDLSESRKIGNTHKLAYLVVLCSERCCHLPPGQLIWLSFCNSTLRFSRNTYSASKCDSLQKMFIQYGHFLVDKSNLILLEVKMIWSEACFCKPFHIFSPHFLFANEIAQHVQTKLAASKIRSDGSKNKWDGDNSVDAKWIYISVASFIIIQSLYGKCYNVLFINCTVRGNCNRSKSNY